MRLLQVAVPVGKRDRVESVLADAEAEYFLTEETSRRDYAALVFVPTEPENVESLVEELRDAGVQRKGYITVGKLETVLSDKFERQRHGRPTDEDAIEETNGRIAREELRARAREVASVTPNYVVFTVLSTIIATAGLLTNSAAVVVGSMVIAPLIGPAIAASVGSIFDDEDLFRTSVRAQFVGLLVAVGSAAAFAGLLRATFLPHADIRLIQQVAERINPGGLALVVALGAGVAGAMSLTSTTSVALVGVAIAVALIPPAATVGLGIAYGDVTAAVSAAILVLVNVLSINVASLATLWVQGYRPEHWYAEESARRAVVRRAVLLVAAVLVLSSALAVTTVNISENAEFERTVADIASETDARVLSVDVSYRTELFLRHPSAVTVRTVGGSANAADALRERIVARTEQDVTVVVIREDGDVSTARQLGSPTANGVGRSPATSAGSGLGGPRLPVGAA
ncbi:TIGR00341 family protein [Halorussus gelatinilyticus]|uniref:TIGR00341 family protein n=1 Tax=Halorussus gelatinilyticus TaxID=2937524 RepID=A0A8U0ILG7_9EURY|nr:TIGR00341 family protein [Halorussus gelatinilyticus]UPW01182.1 TIGR00341 family protein [Halorussus gelatinilyticus]